MDWNLIVEKLSPYVVKIETPQGHGTGFLCVYNDAKDTCGIATANHVVAHAEEWQEPIRIHGTSGSTFLKASDRAILFDEDLDSAVVLCRKGDLDLPAELIPLLPTQNRLPIGAEVGWLGYPAIGPRSLCFFAGNISAWVEGRHSYLIDGVAINGVSGGPVVTASATEGVQIVGSISMYMVNRATGEALPGLSVAQDVSHFQSVASHVRSVDDANRTKSEQQKTQAVEYPAAGPTIPIDSPTTTATVSPTPIRKN